MFFRIWLYQNHHRLIAVDLSWQKVSDADPKAIHQIQYVGQWKTHNCINAVGRQSVFFLTILEKIKKNEIKIFSRKVNSIMKDGILSRSKS